MSISTSLPEGRPLRFFLDRNMGSVKVPVGLRAPDDAIRRKNPEEQRVLRECGLRAFVVNAQLRAEVTAERFAASLPAIVRACRSPGPFVYRLHPNRIERLRLPPWHQWASSGGTERSRKPDDATLTNRSDC